MNISFFGLGYVGCVGMACLAEHGHRLVGVDINKEKIELLNRGESPIVEKGLQELIAKHRKNGNIRATTDSREAVLESEVSFLCVGTPNTPNGHLDLRALLKVGEEIGEILRDKERFHTVVIRSTVPPGTNRSLTELIAKKSGREPLKDFAVVSNPEFLREGTAIADFFDPPYTLVGTDSSEAEEVLKKVYRKIEAPFLTVKITTAEMLKYVNNTFHALKITFANEVDRICRKVGVDSHELMDVFCQDTKLNISPKYLKPGFAYGGSCLPKDLKALVTLAHDNYVKCPVIDHIEPSNEQQKLDLIDEIINSGLDNIGFLGLAFKAGTDDLRNSPIVDVIERLLGKGYNIKIYDKNVYLSRLIGSNKEFIMKKIPYISKFLTDDLDKLIKESKIIIIVNPEQKFKEINFARLTDKKIIDLAGITR